MSISFCICEFSILYKSFLTRLIICSNSYYWVYWFIKLMIWFLIITADWINCSDSFRNSLRDWSYLSFLLNSYCLKANSMNYYYFIMWSYLCIPWWCKSSTKHSEHIQRFPTLQSLKTQIYSVILLSWFLNWHSLLVFIIKIYYLNK